MVGTQIECVRFLCNFKKNIFKIPSPPWVMFYVLIRCSSGDKMHLLKNNSFSKYCIFYFTELSYSQKTYKFFIMFQVDLQNHWSHVLHEHYITNAQVSDLNFLRASAQVKHIIKCNTCFKECVKTYKCTSST